MKKIYRFTVYRFTVFTGFFDRFYRFTVSTVKIFWPFYRFTVYRFAKNKPAATLIWADENPENQRGADPEPLAFKTRYIPDG